MTPSATSTPRRRWVYRVLIILLVLLVPLLGYGIFKTWQLAQLMKMVFAPVGTTTIIWDEEVKLNDGRVIVIKRREATGGGGFPINTMNKRGLTKYYEFCYPEMGVYWKSKPSYHPEILGIVNGKAYVKVPIWGPEKCMFHDYPATNAIYYVWEGGAWKKIPYEQFPKEIRRTNLLRNPWGKKPEDDARGLVTLTQKENKFDRGIYGAMRRTNGRIQSDTDYPHMQGECESNRHVRVQTDSTPEVFLPATPDLCQIPKQGGNTP